MTANRRESRLVRPGEPELLVRRWGPEQPRAEVVLVHGYAEHTGRYDRLAEHLDRAGVSLVGPDLRGHGASEGPRATIGTLAEVVGDVLAVWRESTRGAPERPRFLMGHSMGGLIATSAAQALGADVRGLILSGPALVDPAGFDMLLSQPEFPEIILGSDGLSRDPAVAAEYDADPLNHRGAFPEPTVRMLARGGREVRSRFGELTLPLLVMHGAEDPIVAVSGSTDCVAGVSSGDRTLRVFPGLRHEILNEPEGPAVAAEIARWVEARLPGRPATV